MKNDFYACFRTESCLGGDEAHPLGECDEGYNGILCANCDPGYFKGGESSCTKCPGLTLNILIFAALLFVLVAIIVLLVRSSLYSVDVKKPLHAVYYKIFMNHFQLIAAVSSIDFSWPAEIATIISSQQKISDAPATVLSVDCLLMDLAFGDAPKVRLNYVRIVMYAFLPFGILVASWLYWRIHGFCTQMDP